MKNILLILLLVVSQGFAEEWDREKATHEWFEENPHSLPHWMTPEELTRLDEIGRDFYPTDPPVGPVRNIAEFEHMLGVLIRYPFGISYDIIAEMSEDVKVITIVTSQSQENYVLGQYASHGVNLDNCEFLYAPTDTYWTRDYGPWFVVDGTNQVGIVNFIYNRPRPNDNDIPIEMADFLNIPLYGMELVHSGGNYMTESMGISASTNLVWSENSDMTHAEIAEMVEDYLGVHTYHVVADPNNTYIRHIDCWGKFLDIDKIMIREVPSSHSQYDEIEETVDYFESQTSSYGTPFEIYRVYTPSNQPYTNSLILNKKVLVPVTGSSWDDDAIASYEAAMPGYEVLGFTGSWASTDALHCRTKGVADIGMLYVEHVPVSGAVPAGAPTTIEAQIIPYSGQAMIADSALVYYRLNGGQYTPVTMSHVNTYTWQGSIPGQPAGTEIAYYLHAVDQSGRQANHPYIGAPDPHIFTTEGLMTPTVMIDASSGQIVLTWSPVPGATSYTVYSSASPYTGFSVDTSGVFNGASWTTDLTGESRFYYVTASD
jgi:agmatine deiminase